MPARTPPGRAGLGTSSRPQAHPFPAGPAARTHQAGGAGRAAPRGSDPLGARLAHGPALRSAGPSPGRGAGLRAGPSACGEAAARPDRAGRGSVGHACAHRRAQKESEWTREEEREEEEKGLAGRAGGAAAGDGDGAGPRLQAGMGWGRRGQGAGVGGEGRVGVLPVNRARIDVSAQPLHALRGTMSPNKGLSAFPRSEPCFSLTRESEAGKGGALFREPSP